MALLQLKDVGKIYASENNIAVGIRNVNLSFDKGEFVAVTGKSGSGKSTLLNVISGMDTYEEGELYINGAPTSHYMQPQWEQYRQQYISFIFQDYNILDSFTVMQNVELALMHIQDPKARRNRALQLLQKVGLGDRVNQRGSKLSGGQKQRTVIARALAKDSPIILADEPTGNLDSATGEEIIRLLHEISQDKLVIVVTHNFEQVQDYATREIRVYDGAIESDREVRAPQVAAESEPPQMQPREKSKDLRKGLSLGAIVFKAKPKLSAFLCLMLTLGAVAMFAVTSFNGDSFDFDKDYVFNNISGRVVVATRDGKPLGEDNLSSLAHSTGALDSVYYDSVFDEYLNLMFYEKNHQSSIGGYASYGKNYGKADLGRYPERPDEVLLYLPLYNKNSANRPLGKTAVIEDFGFTVCGIKFFYDNTKEQEILLTREGFTFVGNLLLLKHAAKLEIYYDEMRRLYDVIPSLKLSKGEYRIYYDSNIEDYNMADFEDPRVVTTIYENSNSGYDYDDGEAVQKLRYETETQLSLNDLQFINKKQAAELSPDAQKAFYVSLDDYREFAESAYSGYYRQGSLFYKSNRAAEKAAKKIENGGKYVAVTADTEYVGDPLLKVFTLLSKVFMLLGWVIEIVFLAFVINLCTSRSVMAFKSDMAVMRSMGIPVKIIKIGIYVRMLLSLLPAFAVVTAVALLVYLLPSMNAIFTFLRWWQYVLIAVGMIAITLRVTRKQVKKLFGESVKKSLNRSAAA